MNTEEELTDILRKVEWGQLDSAVAFDRILRLFSVVGRIEQLPNECVDPLEGIGGCVFDGHCKKCCKG